jgi:transglutaminase-like putative cysteine protease
LNYRIRHVTTYDYEDPVSVSHHVVRLTPRNLLRQKCIETRISIVPAPSASTTLIDYFGNVLTFFGLQEPHDQLIVEASSELEVQIAEGLDFSASPRWKSVPQALSGDPSVEGSRCVPVCFRFAAYRRKPGTSRLRAGFVSRGTPVAGGSSRSHANHLPGFPL